MKIISLKFQGHFSFRVKYSLFIRSVLFYNLLHFSPVCLSFPLHICLLEIYPSTCTSTLYAKLFLSSRYKNERYKSDKNQDDICILLVSLSSLSYSILLLQEQDLICVPCPKTPVCNVMYYHTHAVVGDPCPEKNEQQTKRGQDRKGETPCLTKWCSPSPHHLASVSTQLFLLVPSQVLDH